MSSWTHYSTANVMMADEVLHRFGRELGRCPFCKSLHNGLYMGPNPHVTCLQCGADGPISKSRNLGDYYERHIIAIDKWNLAA